MRILITGGAGFLGKHLCRAFVKAGHTIKIIDTRENPEFSTTIADVRDAERMKAEVMRRYLPSQWPALRDLVGEVADLETRLATGEKERDEAQRDNVSLR